MRFLRTFLCESATGMLPASHRERDVVEESLHQRLAPRRCQSKRRCYLHGPVGQSSFHLECIRFDAPSITDRRTLLTSVRLLDDERASYDCNGDIEHDERDVVVGGWLRGRPLMVVVTVQNTMSTTTGSRVIHRLTPPA